MATLNFPDEPTTGDIYSDSNSGFSYEWNGTVWISTDPSTASNIKEIDDISGDFDGSETDFTLKVAAVNIEPVNAQQLIVSVGGVMQNAGDDFTVSGATLTFTTAPTAGLGFFGTYLGTALSLNTVADGTVSPSSLTTTSNYLMGGLTVDQSAGIITAYQFKGDGSGLTGVASTDNIKTSTDAYFGANVSIGGSLTVQGTETIINVEELNVQDKTIGIGSTSTPTATTQDGAGAIIYGQTHIDILYDVDKAALGISTGVNVSGFVTATRAQVGTGVTITNTGIDAGIAAGIITAKEYYGDASNMTGAGSTCSVSGFSPPANSANSSALDPCIAINYNQGIKAGSGDITFRKDTASGTVVQTFGVGSSVSYTHGQATITPTDDLDSDQKYYVVIPNGGVQNLAESSSAGGVNDYFFTTKPAEKRLYGWGYTTRYGASGNKSSPIQITGPLAWTRLSSDGYAGGGGGAITQGGALYTWGDDTSGWLGQNSQGITQIAPKQVGTETTWSDINVEAQAGAAAIKTDGTLWVWGRNTAGDCHGQAGQNNVSVAAYSSPMQVGTNTTWRNISGMNEGGGWIATKTDGTLWSWGRNDYGQQAQNNSGDTATSISSPTQIGTGTDWARAFNGTRNWHAVKTTGTLWACGLNSQGYLGDETTTARSSPVQIGTETTWSSAANAGCYTRPCIQLKTDGTMWTWGNNGSGELGQDNTTQYSSPKQVGTLTNWDYVNNGYMSSASINTDGYCFTWGSGNDGRLGQGNSTQLNSPKQLGSTSTWALFSYCNEATNAVEKLKV